MPFKFLSPCSLRFINSTIAGILVQCRIVHYFAFSMRFVFALASTINDNRQMQFKLNKSQFTIIW